MSKLSEYKRPPHGMILSGDAVFFNCTNPATGRVKRLSIKNQWADVEWNDGSGRIYTKRVDTRNLFLLVPVLNEFIQKFRREEHEL